MRLRNLLAVLAIVACFLGCRSEEKETIPDALIGVWKTSTPGYEDNSLELRKDAILFGLGQSRFSVNSVFKVKIVPQAGEKTYLITIYYVDEEGKENAVSVYYDPTLPGSIRFKNQMRIEWKLFEPRESAQQGPPPRPRPTGLWWKRYDSNIAMALLGIALTAGATLWRWYELRVEREAAAVENTGPRAARRMGGDGESAKMTIPEESIDWTQAPDTVPLVVAEEQRRSERILLKIPVHVAGVNIEGNAFGEHTFTVSINRHGAYIWLRGSPRQGDQVIVTNVGTHRSSAFRLCESSKDASGEYTAWGIECLDPNANFWQIRFPEKLLEPSAEETITALVVCATCHSREVAELSVAQFRSMLERGSIKRVCSDCGAATKWKFMLLEATTALSPGEIPAVSVPSGDEKRREKRIVARLPIRLRHPEDGRVERTFTENVSRSGVCCAASMALNVNDVIFLTFESATGPSEDENRARIMWCSSMGEGRKTLYGIGLERKDVLGPGPRVL